MVSEGDAIGTNPITATEKELEAKLLPSSGGGKSDSDVELMEDYSVVDLMEDYSDVELFDGPGGRDAKGEEGDEL